MDGEKRFGQLSGEVEWGVEFVVVDVVVSLEEELHGVYHALCLGWFSLGEGGSTSDDEWGERLLKECAVGG